MVQITLVCFKGAITVILLKGVLYVPGFLTNLISVSRLWEKSVYWCSNNFTLRMTKTDTKIGICKLVGSLFMLQTNKAQDFAMVTMAVQNIQQKPIWELLHARLGHPSIDGIKKLCKMTTRLDISTKLPSFFCEPCIFAKQIRHILHQPSEQETQALAMVHTDLISLITPAGYNGFRYYLFLTDNAIRVMEGELFKSNSQMAQAIPRYTNKIERQVKLKFRTFRSDNGGEYVSKQLQKWAGDKGIQ